jgi:hypothetical protein
MKDLFSSGSALYQQARPSYPQDVVQEILNKNHDFFIQSNIFYPKKIPDGIRD